jgi:hypothetical protein
MAVLLTTSAQGDSVTNKSPPRLQRRARFYVYRLIDPRNDVVFYVGKGQGRRAWHHQENVVAGRLDGNARKNEIIADILELGLSVIVDIVEWFDDADDALDFEYRLIQQSSTLTNDRRGFHGGAQIEARLLRLRNAKRVQIDRTQRINKLVQARMEKVARVTRDPLQRAEAEKWIRKEVRERLMWPDQRASKVRRRSG